MAMRDARTRAGYDTGSSERVSGNGVSTDQPPATVLDVDLMIREAAKALVIEAVRAMPKGAQYKFVDELFDMGADAVAIMLIGELRLDGGYRP